MNLQEAYNNGRISFERDIDIWNCPSYYSPREREEWTKGYDDACADFTASLVNDQNDDLKELDFH